MQKLVSPIYEGIKEYKTTLEYSDDSYFVNDNFMPFILSDVEIMDVSKLCCIIKERGKTPALMVRKNNTPAVRAYTSLGVRYYDDYSIITFEI